MLNYFKKSFNKNKAILHKKLYRPFPLDVEGAGGSGRCSITPFPTVTPVWPSGTISISTTGDTLSSLSTAPSLGSLASSAAGRLAM